MLLSLLLVLAATEPALPASTQMPTPVSAQKIDDPNAVVCRKEMVTGSRFPTKVCRRKADMAQKQQDDQERLRQSQRPSSALSR